MCIFYLIFKEGETSRTAPFFFSNMSFSLKSGPVETKKIKRTNNTYNERVWTTCLLAGLPGDHNEEGEMYKQYY